MVDYYKILGIEPTATVAEIKSAYRRLARKQHPDLNGGAESAARDFAMLALAYRTLNDPQERAHYDAQLAKEESSVLHSDNIHARRMRQVAAQARWDRVVDTLLENDRRATFELQRAVFTTVSLFLSTFLVVTFKPRFWQNFDGYLGRAVLLTLFALGVWHLASRLREYFRRYTYQPRMIHDSIMREEEKPDKPFTRFAASAFLIIGYVTSIVAGLLFGSVIYDLVSDMNYAIFFFDQQVRPDLLFYPPIAVLIVDTMHTVANKID
ncbi:MAG TPA: DnaJ domain-containing protein [Pyrinomonadaceae bacterium]